MSEALPEIITARIFNGLRLATVMITFGQLCGLSLPLLVENAGLYRPLQLEIAAFAVLVAVAGLVAVFLWRQRPLGGLRWVLLIPVSAATVMALAAVPPEHLVSEAEWSYSVMGWFGLLLLLEHSLAAVLVFLAVHQAVNFGQLIAVGQADRAAVVGMAVAGVIVLGYQLAVAFATVLMRRIADTAATVARNEEELRTAEAVAERVHLDRQQRYSEVDADTVRLLAGLATGVLDPARDDVRNSCAVAAARMRRLFAEHDEVPDPLLHEVRACIDTAERRGIAVSFSALGSRPDLSMRTRRALTDPVLTALVAAASRARVTVLGSDTTVTVSVVADAPSETVSAHRAGEVTVTSLADAGQLWVEATWQATN